MKYPKFIIPVSLFLAILIGGVFTFPTYKNYLKIAQDLVDEKTFLLNRSQYFKEIEEAFKKLEGRGEEVDKISSMLPKQLDTSSLLNYFNRLSKEKGLILKEMLIKSGGNLSEIKRIKTHQISLKIAGTYPSFKSFLESLERSARLFKVEKITFSVPEETEIYDFDLQLIVHSY
ncbi:MAG: type 4a pilus biogenesis protein PilO [Candidatus Pacebacteria bacterium]|nr:type 4a pilus biogenesis protein PilO [Candidatus Paceibacterota bacterium]